MPEIVFKFDPTGSSVKYPDKVYHGTRTSEFVLRAEGLRYLGEEHFLNLIRTSLEEIDLSYESWYENQKKMIKKGKICILWEMRKPNRGVVWVTDSENNAWSYARRSPEIVSEAVRNEMYRLHGRKKDIVRIANESVDKSIEWIGEPKVVVLDAKSVGARIGCNQPLCELIPPSAIIDILYRPTLPVT
jgi:hypothetical protein